MNKIRSGFLMIDFLVYLALLSLLSLLLMNITVSVMFNKKKKLAPATVLSLLNSFDLLATDIKQAPGNVKRWKKMTEQGIIWTSGHEDIGWHIKNNVLVRTHGDFNVAQDRWIKQTKSIASTGISGLQFIIEKKKINDDYYVTMVTWHIESDNNLLAPSLLHRSVALENKLIV